MEKYGINLFSYKFDKITFYSIRKDPNEWALYLILTMFAFFKLVIALLTFGD